MPIWHQWTELPADGRPRYAAVGTFDGVHRGHQALLGRAASDARRDGALAVAVTFDPLPRTVFDPDHAPPVLSTVEERAEQIARQGLDGTLVLPFDRDFATVAAEDFVRDHLCGRGHLAAAYVGYNFTFGHRGSGTPELLRRIGREVCGLRTVVVEPQAEPGEPPFSSTAARAALADGDVGTAARLLGRPYSVRGEVIHGDQRGRELGFPTANLAVPPSRAMPPVGVYAGFVRLPNGAWQAAAISWGRRPTFGAGELLLEAYLLDFAADLYGRLIDVAFLARLRGEERFPDAAALMAQMHADVARTRDVCSRPPKMW